MPQAPVTIRLHGEDAQVEIDGRRFIVEASAKDGRRNGCPGELIIAALGSWIVLTLSAVAEAKSIALEKLDVHIDHEVVEGRPVQTRYAVRIEMGNGLDAREKAILFNSARSCHVHKMLAGEVSFDFSRAWETYSSGT